MCSAAQCVAYARERSRMQQRIAQRSSADTRDTAVEGYGPVGLDWTGQYGGSGGSSGG